ncbi:MAG: formylmethanofuran dehydrogenase subunit E family protein [Candidatus Bathyarchaeia archaeon]
MPTEQTAIIEFARQLHGHVGPYLVIGLKMGAAAKKALNIPDAELAHLRAEVAVPLYPPFSCLLDGIQVATTCTIGNQRLQFKNSKTIQGTFVVEEPRKIVKIALTKHFREILEERKKEDKLSEAYAWELAEVPENQLFKITVE